MTPLATNLLSRFAQARVELGMTMSALARRSGVSEPTVKRIFAGRMSEASFASVSAIAAALGTSLDLAPLDPDQIKRDQARRKAERIARLVQGTSALEGQAVDDTVYRRLVEKTYHELMAGSARRLWSE